MQQEQKIREVLDYLHNGIKDIVLAAVNELGDRAHGIEEIRFRTNTPISIFFEGKTFYITTSGEISSIPDDGFVIYEKEMKAIFQGLCEHSVYAYLEDIKQGFITLRGGHRVGICGTVVMHKGNIDNIKDISGINVRIAREVKGAANRIMKEIVYTDGGIVRIKSTLIVSPPQCGKTTMLRDIARQISNIGINVGVADERSEIAACYKGVKQNDLGINTDVLDGCPKAKGMIMLLRSMSPQVLITDEIATEEDVKAIRQALHSGVSVIASIHGDDDSDVVSDEKFKDVTGGSGFCRVVILSRRKGAGTVERLVCI